jgi:sec-independent protein translocase protein TatC
MALDTPALANWVLSIFSVASGEKAYNGVVTYGRVMSGDERRGPDDESGGEASPEDSPATGDLADLPYKELQSLAADHGFSPVGHSAEELRARVAAARTAADDGGVATDDSADAEDTATTGSGDGTARNGDTTDDEEWTADDGTPATEIPTVDGELPDAVSEHRPDPDDDPEGVADDDAASDDREATTDDEGDAEDDADESHPAVGPDGSVPDWVKSDEPTLDDALGPDGPHKDLGDEPDDHGLEPVDDEEPDGPVADARAQSDGGATVTGGTEQDPDFEYYDDDSGFAEGPAHDEEMPLADHIEEMVKRLGVVIIAMALVSVLVLPFAVDLVNFIWYSILGSVQSSVTSPRAYQPLSLVLARLKVATLAGFVVALPVFVYETYLFMRPGLYKHERRYYLAAVPTSLVLAFIGVAFAFYLVLPFIFSYFVNYSEQAADIAFGLTETFGLMLLLMGFFAAVFQIPLLIMLAVMMGLTTREWLAARRLYFWGGFLGVALLFSPDPTGLAPFVVAITMVTLFEGTLLLLRWTQR